ncbi:MAG: AAA family ATPase [Polyangiaceae bacterium]|nr:AAA family ATPase [Polyangiaceae bacterium]
MAVDTAVEDFAGTERFRVLGKLGKGGMGVVYEVLDTERNEHVALKTLRKLSANAVLRFKNEFRALQDIDHPNLVRLGELFEEAGQWFFTMELVEGVSFLEYVRPDKGVPAPTPQLSIAEDEEPTLPHDQDDGSRAEKRRRDPKGYDELKLRSALGQLASGLHALHLAHKVHRDIKPSNVLVTPEGRVVILDFGLVTEAAYKRVWPDDHLVGTVSYMAPEQAAQKPVGPAADWYATGVVLYQSLTGKLPVRGTTQEVLVLKQAIEPAPPHALADVAPDLDQLCMVLLRIDPASRPDGPEVLRRLSLEPEVTSGRRSGAFFVGREREISTLRQAFSSVHQGPVTVLVDGESGVGKSALAQRFAETLRIERRDTVVLAGRCYERETVPYKAVDGVIDALSRYLTTLPAAQLSKLVVENAGLLGQVFPVLRRIEPIARSPRPPLDKLDPIVLRTRLFAGLRDLFGRIGQAAPLVLLIDDLQWADADSLALLAEVLRGEDAPRLLLVATVRAASKEEPGYQLAQDLAERIGGDVRTVHVSTLPPEDARALAMSLIEGTSVDIAPTANSIAEAAGGHPLFIDELVRQRRTRKDTAGPIRLDEALYERVVALEPAARHVLNVVALAGIPIVQEVAAQAADMDFGALSRLISLLRTQNFVRTSGARKSDTVEPYHDRVREAVAERLDPESRTKLHLKLALALEAAGDTDLEALAIHYQGAGDNDRAADYAARAADYAASAFAFDRAARLYEMALTWKPVRGLEGALLQIRLGESLANAGRGRAAATAYLAAAPSVGAAEALDCRRKAAEQLLRSGHIDEAFDTYREVLAAIDMKLPATTARAFLALVGRLLQVKLRGLKWVERDAQNIPPEDLLRIDTCFAVSSGLGLVDTVRGYYFQERNLLLSLASGEPHRIARAIALEASYSSAEGGRKKERTQALLTQAEALAERLDHPYAIAWATGAGGMAATLEGRWTEGHSRCEQAEVLFRDRCTGVAWEIDTMHWFSLWSMAYLGKLAELVRRVPERIREAEDRGDLYANVCHSTGLASLVWLAKDAPTEARKRSEDALARWSQRTFHVEHWWAMLGDRQVDLYEGQAKTAWERVRAEWPRLEGSLLRLGVQLTLLEATHLRARCALSYAQVSSGSEREDLLRAAERDARRIEKEGEAWSNPLARLIQAGVANIRGDADTCASRLHDAVAGFVAADMGLYSLAAGYRLGQVEQGERGKAACSEGEQALRNEGVEAPLRFLNVLAPGFDS